MAMLQVREIDDGLYDALKRRAKRDNRSISQEVVSILENCLSFPHNSLDGGATSEFLELSWDDNRSEHEIADDIRKSRNNKETERAFNGVFD